MDTQTQQKFAIVLSQFNQTITDRLFDGAYQHLLKSGIDKKNIEVIRVPGAVEIPLAAKLFAKQKRYQAIICLAAVIRGETDHYDYVCSQVSDGCQKVMLEFDLPVIFGVLTTQNDQQALERTGGKAGHKGEEAAAAALLMANVVSYLTDL